jgi:hypothetical protein
MTALNPSPGYWGKVRPRVIVDSEYREVEIA